MIEGHGDDVQGYEGIRLNFSSNIYGHFNHGSLFRHLAECLPKLSHYPEPSPRGLEERLAGSLGLEPSQVMVTSGATEAIYLIAQAFAGGYSTIIGPTFSEYGDACRLHGHKLREIFDCSRTPLAGLPRQLPPDGGLVWLCVPNNPTGGVLDKGLLFETISRTPETIFVMDASYAPYSTLPQLTPKEGVSLPNLVMLHSMTKQFGVPGLRLGYVTASPTLLSRLRPLAPPWAVNQMALDAGLYLLDHEADLPLPVQMLNGERERMARGLVRMGGVEVYSSDCHILLCRLGEGMKACELKDYLALRHGILIRNASNFRGLDEGCFRLAVQDPEENDELLRAVNLWMTR